VDVRIICFINLDCVSGGIAKIKQQFFIIMRKIPSVRAQIEAEIKKTAVTMEESLSADLKPGMTFIKRLPMDGKTMVSVLN